MKYSLMWLCKKRGLTPSWRFRNPWFLASLVALPEGVRPLFLQRFLTLPLTLIVFSAWVLADADAPAPPEIRLTEFRRDLELLEAFVDQSVTLAKQDDPLARARICNELAEMLARQIKEATANKRTERVVALGDMLQTVLVRGVADNLERARADDLAHKDVAKVGGAISEVTGAVEQSLKKAMAGDKAISESMAPALESLARARVAVESAMSGKKRDRDSDKGRGKGKGKSKLKF